MAAPFLSSLLPCVYLLLEPVSFRPVNPAVEIAPVKPQLVINPHAWNVRTALVPERVRRHAEITGRILNIHEPLRGGYHAFDPFCDSLGNGVDHDIAGMSGVRFRFILSD